MNKILLEIFENSIDSYYSFSYYLTKNTHDAEDVLQDVRLVILSTKFKHDILNTRAYLYKLTKTTSLKYIKNSPKHENIDDLYDHNLSCNDDHMMGGIYKDIIGACFTALPDDVRKPLFEHFAYNIPLRSLVLKYGISYSKLRHWKNKFSKIAKKFL